jgi:hypothetical protein
MFLQRVSAYVISLSFVNHFPEDGQCRSKHVEGVPCTYRTGVFLLLCGCWNSSCDPNISLHWPIKSALRKDIFGICWAARLCLCDSSTVRCWLGRHSSNRPVKLPRTASMNVMCVSICSIELSGPGYRIVTTPLYRRYEARIQAGAREYFFFAKRPDRLWGPPSLQCLLRFFPGSRAAGALCWPI